MRLHEQVPFEEWICMSLAAMFTRHGARIFIVPVRRAQIQTLSDVLDLVTHPTSLVLAYDSPIQVRHCSRLYASFFSQDPEQPSGELFELFYPTLWRHFSFTERFREWSSRVRRFGVRTRAGNFLFLTTLVGAHSELAHLSFASNTCSDFVCDLLLKMRLLIYVGGTEHEFAFSNL